MGQVIAALFVEEGGVYYGLDGVDPWGLTRDAMLYAGPQPVVAHPPCQLWVNFAALNWSRYGRERPAWLGGSDGGAFSHALSCVRLFGGVLEHPAGTHAWTSFSLRRPARGIWSESVDGHRGWVTEVCQSAYGHAARKTTWLYAVSMDRPADLDWSSPPGTHQIGWFDRKKPTLGKRAASRTPERFRDVLIAIARSAQ